MANTNNCQKNPCCVSLSTHFIYNSQHFLQLKKNRFSINPIFFSKLIIIAGLLPIFSFQKVEGKMFAPLAWTLGFALLGALLLTLTLIPLLSSILLRKNVREKHNVFVKGLTKGVMKLFNFSYAKKRISILIATAAVAIGLFSFKFPGTEFLPELDEGAIYIRATCPLSVSPDESRELANKMRKIVLSYPEVRQVMSQTGRPNDGTDATGFYNIEFHVDIYPKNQWKSGLGKEQLIEKMQRSLAVFPGIDLLNVPFAIIGGIAALLITGTNFSISAGIGFIALFGICIQNGVILISVFKSNLQKIKKQEFDHHSLEQAIKQGVQSRVRPVIMTALMAAIGLLPAALSHGIGSETSKPLAIVVIGGLITATVLTLLVFPLFFYAGYRKMGQKMD